MSLVKSSIIVTALSLLVALISFANQIIIARFFGAKLSMDLYINASSIPILISALISSALSYSLIPHLIKSKHTYGEDYSIYVGRMLTVVLKLSFFICLAASFIFLVVFHFYSNTFFGENRELTFAIYTTSWFTAFLSIIAGFMNSVFNSEKKFIIPVILSFLPYSLSIIFCIMCYKYCNVFSISIGLFIGTFLGVLISVMLLKDQITFRGVGTDQKKEINLYIKRMPSVAIAMLSFTVFQSIDSFWAPKIGVSNLSYLGYCQRLLIAVGNLVIIGPSTVLVPRLTESIVEGNRNVFFNDATKVIKIIISLSAFIMIVISVLSTPIIQLIFQRGAFSENDTNNVASILPYMLVGMIFMLCVVMLFRAFFAAEKNMAVTWLGLLSTGLYFIFSGIGSKIWGVKGIAIAYAVDWILIFCISLGSIYSGNYKLLINRDSGKFLLNLSAILVIEFFILFSFYRCVNIYVISPIVSLMISLSIIVGASSVAFFFLATNIFVIPEIQFLFNKLFNRRYKNALS